MALSEAILEEEEKLEPGPSNGGSMFPQEHQENKGVEEDTVPSLSGIEASNRLDREPLALMKEGEDWLRRSKATNHLQQLSPPPDLWAQRVELREVQKRSARLLVRRQPHPSSQRTSGVK